jgi:hypothetical protein
MDCQTRSLFHCHTSNATNLRISFGCSILRVYLHFFIHYACEPWKQDLRLLYCHDRAMDIHPAPRHQVEFQYHTLHHHHWTWGCQRSHRKNLTMADYYVHGWAIMYSAAINALNKVAKFVKIFVNTSFIYVHMHTHEV